MRMTKVVRTKTSGIAIGLMAGVALGAFAAAPLIYPAADARPITVKAPEGAPLSFADLIDRVSPAVVSVNVITDQEVTAGLPSDFMERFREQFRGMPGFDERFFEDREGQSEPETRERRSLGSGFFISEDGYIVTNNHVIDKASEIEVVLEDGRELRAELIGTDERTDLAVLKVDEDGGPFGYVQFKTDAELRRGDWIVAVGNPFGFGGTATAGIVSASDRALSGGGAYTDYLQIDASINRGNSGGPTFDLKGQVVGVNTAIISPTGGSVGIGFAIPAELAKRITDALIKDGKVSRGWLGVSIQDFNEESAAAIGFEGEAGARVASIVEDSPAEDAGFERNDVILSINGKDMRSSREVTQTVGNLLAGSRNRFEILRSGRKQILNVTVGTLPDDVNNLPTIGENGPAGEEDSDAGETAELLGMTLRKMSDADRKRLALEDGTPGLSITDVKGGTAAGREGLQEGFAILEANFEPISTTDDLERVVDRARNAGREAVLLSVRVNTTLTSTIPVRIDRDDD